MIRIGKEHSSEIKLWLTENRMPSSIEDGMPGGYQNTILVMIDRTKDEAMFKLRFSEEIADCPKFDAREELKITMDYYRYMGRYTDLGRRWRYDPQPFAFQVSFDFVASPNNILIGNGV